MNQKRIISIVLALLLLLLPCMSITVFANSSWRWFTGNPLTILPWIILGTLIIETFIVCYFNHIRKIVVPFVIIVLANVLSFLAPYSIWSGPILYEPYEGVIASVNYMVSKLPLYIVGMGFLILTLIVEIPVVYNLLKKRIQNKKRLLITIISANVITTIIASIIERYFCRGSW